MPDNTVIDCCPLCVNVIGCALMPDPVHSLLASIPGPFGEFPDSSPRRLSEPKPETSMRTSSFRRTPGSNVSLKMRSAVGNGPLANREGNRESSRFGPFETPSRPPLMYPCPARVVDDETAMKKVAMFIPCFVDQLTPEVGLDMARVLQRIGYDTQFPDAQTCCGQPGFNSGYWTDARPLAERLVHVFRSAEVVVCPSGSCTTMVRNFYPELLARTTLVGEAVSLGRRVFEFSEFLVKVGEVSDVGARFPHRVAYHDACHALRELHLKQEPRELLRHVREIEFVEMPYSEECCGFGGTFATKFSMISSAMGETKSGNAESSGAEYLTSTDPSCLLHLDGVLRRRRSRVLTIHLAGILAQTEGPGGPARLNPAPERS